MNMYRIICYFDKISDIFPIFGGSLGAVSQANILNSFPSWEAIIAAILLSIVGSLFGYLVKLIIDWIRDKIFGK